MKVAYVCADAGVPIFGTKGCSIHVQEIVRAFLQRGDTVDLYVARIGGDAPSDMVDCRVREFRSVKHASVSEREAAGQEIARRIAHAIPMQRYDLVYERYSLWSDMTQILAGRNSLAGRRNVASILEVNAPLIDEQQSHRELMDRASAERIALNAFQHAQTTVAVSHEVADYVRRFCRREAGICLSSVHVVPNGVDVNRFHPDVAPIDASDDFTIGFVGSLKPWHGVESLIAAFIRFVEAYPQSRLKIIGDGPMRDALERSVDERSSAADGRIKLAGSVSPDQMPSQLASLDVAVAPYLKSKGFYFSPLKVYEYMACGLPVVVSETGQLSTLIDHGSNGLLYEPGNVDQLLKALVRLVESTELRKKLGQAARTTVVRRHSWQHCLDRILNDSACTMA
ncbi:MAG: glycosyltransferase family 4 protein [Planctomycetaceae bacterium]